MITDSGERKEFTTGAVRDMKEGKGRCDLLPLDVVSMWLAHGVTGDSVLEEIGEFQTSLEPIHLFNALNLFVEDYYCGNKCKALLELAIHYEEGAKKYSEWNWTKGIELWSFIDSAVRHYLKVLAGMTDESHERAFMWNLVGAVWTVLHKPEMSCQLDFKYGYVLTTKLIKID